MIRTARIIAVALLAVTGAAHAGSVSLHTASEHAGSSDHLNEQNTGIGYTDGHFTVGYYRNSHYRDSFYAGIHHKFGAGFSATLAGVTGYRGEYTVAGVTPMAMVHWRPFTGAQVSPMVTLAPTKRGGVALLSIDIRVD